MSPSHLRIRTRDTRVRLHRQRVPSPPAQTPSPPTGRASPGGTTPVLTSHGKLGQSTVPPGQVNAFGEPDLWRSIACIRSCHCWTSIESLILSTEPRRLCSTIKATVVLKQTPILLPCAQEESTDKSRNSIDLRLYDRPRAILPISRVLELVHCAFGSLRLGSPLHRELSIRPRRESLGLHESRDVLSTLECEYCYHQLRSFPPSQHRKVPGGGFNRLSGDLAGLNVCAPTAKEHSTRDPFSVHSDCTCMLWYLRGEMLRAGTKTQD